MVTVYEVVTDRILAELEKGVVPWRRPWRVTGGEGMPANLVSKKPYRGINPFLLTCSGYSSPWWVSFKQAKSLGGCVRKGERGCPVVFWKIGEHEDEAGRVRKSFILRYYTVFNVAQVDGIEDKVPKAPGAEGGAPAFTPIESAARIIEGMPLRPSIAHGGDRAFYMPSADRVQLPKPETFERAEGYYSVAFHELSHSTGHASRVGREGIETVAPFGSPVYSREELVAEMSSAFLCAEAGIVDMVLPTSAAYVDNWRRALKADARAVVVAAAAAQKSADFIMGRYVKRAAAGGEEAEAAEVGAGEGAAE